MPENTTTECSPRSRRAPERWLVAFVIYSPGGVVDRLECAGTLVTPTWVLTAAHAVIDPGVATALIAPDSIDDCPVSKMRGVARVIPYPEYDGRPAIPRHDLALVELSAAADDASCVPLDRASRKLAAIGWGQRNAKDPHYSNTPKVAEIDVEELGGRAVTAEHICYGDSGAPLLRDGVQIGLVSSLNVPRDCRKATIYTALNDEYLQWIQTITGRPLAT